MDRSETLLKYEEMVSKYLEQGKQNLKKNSNDVKNELQMQLKSCIDKLCDQAKGPVCYFQISLIRCMIGQGIYRILVSAYDANYFLDRNMEECFFDATTMSELLRETQNHLYETRRDYRPKVQYFDAEKYLTGLAMDFFKSIGNDMRFFFRDFDKWESIDLLSKASKLVVKWGEHRGNSETIFLKEFSDKTQTHFLEYNAKNQVCEWKDQYIYQSFDRVNLSDVMVSMKNFMFIGMRDCQITGGKWENCLMYGSTFRQSFLEQVIFFRCDLSKADFRKARLKQVEFIECKLSGADFTEAQFEVVEYTGSQMDLASFSRNSLACAGIDATQLQQLKVEEEPLCFS